jgi:uncharacterized protein (DUF427 family)
MDRTDGKPIRIPDASHPIAIEPNPKRVVVTAGGRVVVDTTRALTLREASYPPVLYLPREDVDMTLLSRSTTQTYCPYKGDCSYYSIDVGGDRKVDAVWTYEAPYDAVAQIRGFLAFYPNRVDSIEERSA